MFRAGGCGADFTQPLNIAVGGIDGESFVDGWAPGSTAKVVVTVVDGTEIEVTDLVVVRASTSCSFSSYCHRLRAGNLSCQLRRRRSIERGRSQQTSSSRSETLRDIGCRVVICESLSRGSGRAQDAIR